MSIIGESLINKVVKSVREMTVEEQSAEGWSRKTNVIEFTDGTIVFASHDELGEYPGVLLGVDVHGDGFLIA